MSNKCPRCWGALELLDIDGVKIDRCGSCRGIFLDKYELNRLNALTSEAAECLNDGVAGHSTIQTPDASKKIKCLRCSSVMQTVNFSYTSGILIDHCPACESVWLDNGELAKILEFLKASESISEEESASYQNTLNEIKDSANKQKESGFRSISSGGKMGSIVNFVYKMISKVSGE